MKVSFFIPLFLFVFLGACAEKKPKRIQEVRCKYWLQQCHLQARKICSSGYTVVRSVRIDRVGGPQGTYKEFKMLLTCN